MSAIRVGIVALAVVTVAATGAPAALAVGGCSRNACVNVVGEGLHVSRVDASATKDFYGHFHIWGPNLDRNSDTTRWQQGRVFPADLGRDVPNGSWICAEAWQQAYQEFLSLGKACEQITF
jgi:hypothetical protein